MRAKAGLYVKPCNVFSRHQLMTCKQQTSRPWEIFWLKFDNVYETAIIKSSQLRYIARMQCMMHPQLAYPLSSISIRLIFLASTGEESMKLDPIIKVKLALWILLTRIWQILTCRILPLHLKIGNQTLSVTKDLNNSERCTAVTSLVIIRIRLLLIRRRRVIAVACRSNIQHHNARTRESSVLSLVTWTLRQRVPLT